MSLESGYKLKFPKDFIPILGMVNYMGKYNQECDKAYREKNKERIMELEQLRQFVSSRTLNLGAYNAIIGAATITITNYF